MQFIKHYIQSGVCVDSLITPNFKSVQLSNFNNFLNDLKTFRKPMKVLHSYGKEVGFLVTVITYNF